MQVEGRLAAEVSGVKNQEQSEVQSLSNGNDPAAAAAAAAAAAHHESSPEVVKGQASNDMPSTLQYIAQQADISHVFQEDVKSQRQDKTEL